MAPLSSAGAGAPPIKDRARGERASLPMQGDNQALLTVGGGIATPRANSAPPARCLRKAEGTPGGRLAPTAAAVELEALRRDRWAGDVAEQRLEPLEFASGHEHLGAQREVVDVGAQCRAQRTCFRVGVAFGTTAITSNPREIAGPTVTCGKLTNFREDLDSTVGV